MPFTLTKLPNAPVLLFSQQLADAIGEMPEVLAAVIATLDVQTEPIYVIFDTRGAQIDLDGLVQSASAAARGSEAMAHHPMLRESLVVTNDNLLRMAALGARTATFGLARVSVFDTTEDALDYCAVQLGIPAADLRAYL